MADGNSTLIVEDDGVGFDASHVSRADSTSGYGLQIMQERAEAVGARFSVDSSPGKGTRVLVEYAH